MIPIARQIDLHACSILIHGITPIVPVGGTVYVNGIPVARVGDMTGCGAVIVSGFPSILVNGRPMAHVGSLTSHGGCIISGSHDSVGGHVNFQTSRLVVDFARLGAVREDGIVDEKLMAELLADPQLEQRAQAAGALVQSNDTPSLVASFSQSFLITDSDTGKPLANRSYTAVVDGIQTRGLSDAQGLIQISATKADSIIKLHVEFNSPARALTELSEGLLAEDRFTSSAQAHYARPGQLQPPMVVTVNDRAATREMIIRKVRERGHQLVERSEWRAKPPKTLLEKDWNYSMIALHHAGRSYSCSAGMEQMLAIQNTHQNGNKYDDIGYHFGIDCEGNIYEARDIRSKGSGVENFNTGVISIVLLTNLTTTGEGGGIVAMGRQILDAVGVETSPEIPSSQIDAVLSLVGALTNVFDIQHFGGHREFPYQKNNGKICPGDIGMELVNNIRARTKLHKPSQL